MTGVSVARVHPPASPADHAPTAAGGTDPDSPAWQRPRADPQALQADVGIAVALFGASIGSLVLGRAAGMYSDPAGMPLSIAVLAVIVLPLAWRRRRPSAVALTIAAAFVALGELAVPETTIANIALFMALYTVGAWEPDRRRAAWVRGGVITAMGLWLLTSFFRASTQEIDLDGPGVGALTPFAAYMLIQVLINVLYFAGAYWFGNHAWAAARQRAVTRRRTGELEAERARTARQAVTIERLRIARELHDAVAHHVSLMGVQAAAARALLRVDAAQAEDQIEALEESSRNAVAELYTLLGTLRDAEPEDAATAALGVDELPQLVTDAQHAGLRVDLQVVGEPRPLPPLVSLNLFRITQEALTNVVKHAGPGTRTQVRLRYSDGWAEVEVSDDGRGRPGPAPSGGLGIAGMHERVASLAGQIHVGPRSGSGFVVRASFPTAPALAR